MSSALFSILFALGFLFYVSNSCTRIVVDSSENGDIDWIDGIFELDKTLRIDDRFTYKEVNGTRIIYHYSGKSNEKEREIGRWMLGSKDKIGTDDGWAYRLSWSISPDDANIHSLQNNEEATYGWNVYIEEEWTEIEGLQFRCESVFGDHEAMNDFLFVTSNETIDDNVINHQTIHGFYVRISEDTFTKISGSKRVFYHEKGNLSEIYVITDETKMQPNGLPPASIPANRLSKSAFNAPWRLYKSDGKTSEPVSIIVLQVEEDEEEEEEEDEKEIETIYDIMGRYYRELKSEHLLSKQENEVTELNNGMIYPMIGLGTGGISGGVNQVYQTIKEAVVQYHYPAIDSASVYDSEAAIGMLVKENKTVRPGLFLASKVWPTDLYFQATLDSVQKSLNSMKTNYLDLYLIAWPSCSDQLKSVDCTRSKDGKWQQSYEALSKLYAEGILLNIGVGNWNEELMTELLQEFPIKPQIVQNQIDLQTIDWDLKDYFEEQEILIQAYSPYSKVALSEDADYREWKDILKQLSEEIEQDQNMKISQTQLALRFLVENDIAVIPRSSKGPHLKENMDIYKFEFTNDINVRLGGRDVEKQEL